MDEQELKEIFAKNLRELMQENDIRQQDLIDLLKRKYGITANQGTVSSWMNAKKLPRPITIEKIGELFGWDASYMLSDSTRGVEKLLNMPTLEKDSLLSREWNLADSRHRKLAQRVLRLPVQKLDVLELYLDALDPQNDKNKIST